MAYTKEEHEAKLKKIAEMAGDSEEILTELAELAADYDERLSVKEYTDDDVIDASDGRRWSEKYNEANENYLDMKNKYRDRFFSTPSGAKEDQDENITEDTDALSVSFDDLFEEREGDYETK